MRIIGNRLLVSRVEEEKSEGFQTVEIGNSFVYKGKVEQVGDQGLSVTFNIGDIVMFMRYSPDTQEVEGAETGGVKMKIINVADVLATF